MYKLLMKRYVILLQMRNIVISTGGLLSCIKIDVPYYLSSMCPITWVPSLSSPHFAVYSEPSRALLMMCNNAVWKLLIFHKAAEKNIGKERKVRYACNNDWKRCHAELIFNIELGIIKLRVNFKKSKKWKKLIIRSPYTEAQTKAT